MVRRSGSSVRRRALGGVSIVVALGSIATALAPPAAADHLAPVIVETNAAEVGQDPSGSGSVGTETNCPGGWSGGSAQYLGNVTAHLLWTFTVPAGHTGVVSVVGYRDPVAARPFYMWVDPDPMALIPNDPGAQDCQAVLASTGPLAAGTHTINVSGTAGPNSAFLDYFRLVTTSVPSPTGSLAITKISDTPGTFDFTVSCTGRADQAVSITVATTGAPGTTSTPIAGIPTGTACTVSETTAPGFDPQPSQSLTIASGVNTVTFSNVRQTGALVVSKSTVGGSGTFDFTVDCQPGTTFDQTFTLTGTETRRITGIPTGTTCSVTEAASPLFTSAVTPAGGTVTIAPGDNTVSFVNTIRPPVLTLSKRADAATVDAGAAVGFTLTVGNTGPNPAVGVTLGDPLPASNGVLWSITPAHTGPGSCAITGTAPAQVLGCSFGDLAAGASVGVHVSGTTSAATSGPLTNTATARATNHGPVSAVATVTVNRPTLTITKVADATAVTSGTAIGFTVTARNTGPGSATGVTVSDPLPAATGVSWSVSPAYAGPGSCAVTGVAPNQSLSCALGTLAPGASASVRVTSASSVATVGTLTNTATAQGQNHGAVSATASVTLAPAATTTTTTTTAAATTTTTTAPATTTTTTAPATTTTTTTTAPAATTAAPTGPAGVAGATFSQSGFAQGQGTLPRTGSSSFFLAMVGWLLVAGGVVLIRWGMVQPAPPRRAPRG